MSGRYEECFARLKKANKKAFMPFTLLGWPSRDQSLAMIKQMIDCGASALELGIAFSDPVADGPVIQKAAFDTIASGFSVSDAFQLLGDIRQLDKDIPIGILVYFNAVLAQGIDTFFAMAREAGVDGVLIADLPAESASEVLPAAATAGVKLIFLVSPVTTESRLDKILSHASGFLYLVSRLGVTGTGERSTEKDLALHNLVEQVRRRSSVPICAGFGISGKADAERMFVVGVDGVISGSRVIQLAESNQETNGQALQEYYEEMVKACGGASKSSKV